MRIAILILFLTISAGYSVAHSDDQFTKVTVDGHIGYIVTEKLAKSKRLLPFDFSRDATEFWTPTLEDVLEAEKAAHKQVQLATTEPDKAFPLIAKHPDGFAIPTLETLSKQAKTINKQYDKYGRQFVGLKMFDGKKSIYCNYFYLKSGDSYTSKQSH